MRNNYILVLNIIFEDEKKPLVFITGVAFITVVGNENYSDSDKSFGVLLT